MRIFRGWRLILCFLLLFPGPARALALDAASFDPRPVLLAASSSGGVPVGTIVAWPAASNPSDWGNWLECNGQAINAAVYPELHSLLGAAVPDLRGLFLRGHGAQTHSQLNGSLVGVTATLHQSGALGSVQGDSMRNIVGRLGIRHAGLQISDTGGVFGYDMYGSAGATGGFENMWRSATIDASRVVPVASENRPVNMAVRYLIRAKP